MAPYPKPLPAGWTATCKERITRPGNWDWYFTHPNAPRQTSYVKMLKVNDEMLARRSVPGPSVAACVDDDNAVDVACVLEADDAVDVTCVLEDEMLVNELASSDEATEHDEAQRLSQPAGVRPQWGRKPIPEGYKRLHSFGKLTGFRAPDGRRLATHAKVLEHYEASLVSPPPRPLPKQRKQRMGTVHLPSLHDLSSRRRLMLRLLCEPCGAEGIDAILSLCNFSEAERSERLAELVAQGVDDGAWLLSDPSCAELPGASFEQIWEFLNATRMDWSDRLRIFQEVEELRKDMAEVLRQPQLVGVYQSQVKGQEASLKKCRL